MHYTKHTTMHINKKANAQRNNVAYNSILLNELCEDWRCTVSDIDDSTLFVNCNSITHDSIEQDDFTAQVQYDSIDDEAFPVLVYKLQDKFVAWYDFENECGHVA